MIKLKLWFSQLTIGSAIAFLATLATILGKEEAVALLVLIGVTPELAAKVQQLAVGLGALLLLYSRSPKQEPLFTTPAQVSEMPKAQTEAVMIQKEVDKEIAKKP